MTWTSGTTGSVRFRVVSSWMREQHQVGGWWAIADALGHKLHLPRVLQKPICDRFDLSVGMPLDALRRDYGGRLPWWLRR